MPNIKAKKRGWGYDFANSRLGLYVDGTQVAHYAKGGAAIILSTATPAMTAGSGALDIQLTVTGTGTGNTAVSSTWMNVPSGATLALGANQLIHTDGIWEDSGATITGAHIAMKRYEAILGDSDFNNLNIWQLNFTQTISAMFDVNDPAKALGLVSGSTGAAVGSVPFFTTGAGGLKYIRVYDSI